MRSWRLPDPDSRKRRATPHPTRFAGHLLPQGEKDSSPRQVLRRIHPQHPQLAALDHDLADPARQPTPLAASAAAVSASTLAMAGCRLTRLS